MDFLSEGSRCGLAQSAPYLLACPLQDGGAHLLDELSSQGPRLPLNRKEVFYSATVLPGIICSDGLAAFFGLLGKPGIHIDLSPDTANVQIFSEYDLRDAIRGDRMAPDALKKLLSDMTGDTPDLVILVDSAAPVLVVLEAKLFDNSARTIAGQIEKQRANMALLASVMPEYEILHVALVLKSAAGRVYPNAGEPGLFKTITWEEVVEKYTDIPAAGYWVRQLRLALGSENNLLAGGGSRGTHEDGRMTTAGILDAYERPDCIIKSVGCLGANWARLKDDIALNGGTRKWAVSHKDDLPSRHYLGIQEFVGTVRSWMQSALPHDTSSWKPAESPRSRLGEIV
jgi:hypothetical protein